MLFAVLLDSNLVKAKGVWKAILYIPALTSVVISGTLFRLMFTELPGSHMNQILSFFGKEPIRWLYMYPTSYCALLLLACWRWTGVNMLYFLSGLKGSNRSLYESADIDGATAFQKFIYVTLPMLKPTTIYVLTISVYAGLAMFLESFMIWGGNGSPKNIGLTIVGYLYRRGIEKNQMGYASTVGLVLLAIALLINMMLPMSIHIWAPELHFIDGNWYIYYAGGDKDDIWNIRPYVLKCNGQDPIEDTWEELGKMKRADDDEFSFEAFSLDATVFENKGKFYYIWAEKVGVGKQISNLYIGELETPNKLKTVQVLLTTPDYDWERHNFWVNEGPAVIKRNGRIFVTYSASDTVPAYCMGMMTASEDSDLLDPKSWVKERYPILKTDESRSIYGLGHNSFTVDEEGNDIMVYHCTRNLWSFFRASWKMYL